MSYAMAEQPSGLKRLAVSLVAAGYANCACLLTATVMDGLQFGETGGTPDAAGLVTFILSYVFFAGPIVTFFVAPIGIAIWWGLQRANLLKVWVAVPVGLAIGYLIGGLIPLLPDLLLVARISTPLVQIASAIGGGLSGLVIWLGARPSALD